MLSTTAQILQVGKDVMFSHDVLEEAKTLYRTRAELSDEQFILELLGYTKTIISDTLASAMQIFMSESEIVDLVKAMDEMEEIEREVYGK